MTLTSKLSATATLFATILPGPRVGAATPIHFTPPAYTHGVGHGVMHNIHSQLLFTFHAQAGQHVRVNIVGHGPTRGVVLFPNGGQDGGPGGEVFDDQAPQTGLYHLQVTEDSMADQWHGSVTVYVTRQKGSKTPITRGS